MRKKRSFASLVTVVLGLSAMSVASVTEARDRPDRSPPEPHQATPTPEGGTRPASGEVPVGQRNKDQDTTSLPDTHKHTGTALSILVPNCVEQCAPDRQ
jgi:hypothetical protein